ncbi:MAG: aldo/keto reductase [Dehalococcoidia bacterium]|jgi:aryl-alcohol dehydrogenase-like predicted oxidoreductase
MERRKFGVTDLEVSRLCLGSMQFGWTADEAAAFDVMDAFVAAGGNFIDTADVYSRWALDNPGGVAESIIGRWLKERGNRDGLVIATKVAMPVWDGPDGKGLGRTHILRAVEESLRRLQIETIDLYQSHAPDLETPIEETLRAFDDLIKSGKVRYIGASNYTAPLLEEALSVAGEKSLPRYISLQPNYSLVHRSEFEDALAGLCLREKIAVIPYSPLAGGFLTGKYRPDRPQPKSARTYQTRRYENEAGWRIIEALEVIARARETTLAAVAVAWLLAKPVITSPIIGANSDEQFAAILPAVDLRLLPEEVAALDEISAGM